MSQTQQQIICTGSLLTLTVFQEKLMRNFYAINTRLKRLQGMADIQAKTRNIQKQLKFLSTKVDSISEKIPKQGICTTKKEVQSMSKDLLLDLFNNSQDKIKQTQTFKHLLAEIEKVKTQAHKAGSKHQGNHPSNHKQLPAKQNSFTAGTILLSEAKKAPQPSKQLLNQILSKQQSKMVNQIMQQNKEGMNQFQKMKKDIQKLYNMIDNMKVGIGYQHFVQKQITQYQKYQRQGSKSHQGGRKKKSPQKNQQNQKSGRQTNIQKQSNTQKQPSALRGQISAEMQRNPSKNRFGQNINNSKSQTIVKQDFLARKTFNPSTKNQITLLNKDELSGVFINGPASSNQLNGQPHFNKIGQMTRIQYIPQNKLLSKAQRSKSLKKLQRIQKKLRVDDIKDINSVLKQIELRLDNKPNSDVFTQFVKQFEEKLQILRITKDSSNQINDLRRMIYNLDTKMQYIISYLQSTFNQDEAMIVKKNWTCISCDKNVEKFNGKIGQHVNWDSINSKKISPNKIGAFGQTGQLASKIKNLLDNGSAGGE